MATKHKLIILDGEKIQELDKDLNESRTDRQELIPWWKQSVLKNATAIVIGAGAIGNELLKNLALLGFGYVFVCDMDHISSSNLSRTVLFSSDDLGKQKAPVAVQKYREICVDPSARADCFDGNVNADLGAGVFRRMDVVIGCLDNLQTRFETNRKCNLLQKPYFDAGISELTWNLTVTHYPKSPCWACSMSARLETEAMNFERHSCDVTKAEAEKKGHAPTVQVASSMVSALQSQEVIKYLVRDEWDKNTHKRANDNVVEPPSVNIGCKYIFNGLRNEFIRSTFGHRSKCSDNHDSYENVIETEMSADWTLKQMFDYVTKRFGGDYYLSLSGDNKYQKATFITTTVCKHCGQPLDIFKSVKSLKRSDLYHSSCPPVDHYTASSGEKIYFYKTDEERILNLTLHEIGVPYLHILELFDDATEKFLALELTADLSRVMPEYCKR